MDESSLALLFAQGRHAEVAAALIRGEGPQLLAFLRSRLRDRALAEDAYSSFCLDLFRGLPAFQRKCTFRGYAYTLARNAAYRISTSERARWAHERRVGEREFPELPELIRTSTREYQRTETKQQVRALRETLSEAEQTVLSLRIDRGLDFRDIAVVLLGEDASEERVAREAARARKMLQSIKDKLRVKAQASGLLSR